MAWELFRRDGLDGFEMMGVDGDLLEAGPDAGRALACEITIETPSTLPEFIGATESAIETITEQIGGRVAGTSRTATTLWALVYLPSDEHAERFTQVPLPAKASVSVAPTRDPDWTIFERARPVDMEVQSMLDLRLMAELHAAGDTGGVRPIEHTVSGLDADRSSAFVTAARSIGFEPGPVEGDRMTLRHEADPTDITPESWTLRLIAERHGSAYEGWRCAVLGRSHPTPTKRRWRRR